MQINIISSPLLSNDGDSWYPRLIVKTTKKISDPIHEVWRGDIQFWDEEDAEVEGFLHLAKILRRLL